MGAETDTRKRKGNAMSRTTGQIETEAAIYAEGTQYTRDDLLAAWRSLTAEQQEETTCQRFFERFVADSPTEQIRYSADGSICMVWRDGEPVRCPTQEDMDTLPVGPDMTDEDIEQLA